jgi:hypothetical protein
VRAPWTAPCTRCTGPRWTAPFKTKGYLIWAIRARSDGPGRARVGAAASTTECGGARQGLAGASPRRRSRPSLRPRVGATCCAGACARDHGVRGGDRASPAAGIVRGRRGYSGEPGETMPCAKQRGNGRGFLLTACGGSRRAHGRRRGGSRGARRRRRLGRRSGELGARLPRASGTKTCDSMSLSSSWRSQKSKETGKGSNPSPAATDRRRRQEPDAAARGNWCSSACARVL